jgi:Planctomycete cytochrome C
MLNRLFFVCALVCGAMCLSACDEKLSSLAGPTPNLEPTFASIQRDIFEASDSSGRTPCATCHTSTGRNPSGGLNLNHDVAYDQLVNAAGRGKAGVTRVVPGDSSNSYLLQKLTGADGIAGRRMPINGPPYLTNGQVQIIERWVAIGAPR